MENAVTTLAWCIFWGLLLHGCTSRPDVESSKRLAYRRCLEVAADYRDCFDWYEATQPPATDKQGEK